MNPIGPNLLNDQYILPTNLIEGECENEIPLRGPLDLNLDVTREDGFHFNPSYTEDETQISQRRVVEDEKNYFILKQDAVSNVYLPYETQETIRCITGPDLTKCLRDSTTNHLINPAENSLIINAPNCTNNLRDRKFCITNHEGSTYYNNTATEYISNIDRDIQLTTDSIIPSHILDKSCENSSFLINSNYESVQSNGHNSITKTLRNIKRLPPPVQTSVNALDVNYSPDTSIKQSYDLSCTVFIDTSRQSDIVNESCGNQISSSYVEETPSLIGSNGKIYTCTDCGKCFKTKGHLITHSRVHSDIRKFKCNKCDQSFKTQVNLRFHLESHANPKCPHCGKQFFTRRVLSRHIRFVHSLKSFECEQCSRKFKNKKNLIRHYGIHSGVRPFSCKICSKSFLHRSSLNTHLREHVAEQCNKCNITAGSNKNAVHSHSANKEIEIDSLSNKTVEARTLIGRNDIKTNLCSCAGGSLCAGNCSRTKESTASVYVHVCKPFSCSTCGKHFKLKSRLVTHTKTHFPNKEFKCEECGKTFVKKISYNLHMKQHRGERPEFMCDQCSQSYHSQFNLRRHYLKHTSEKNFQCHICTKKFWMKDALQVHLRSHSKEKNFKCTPCGKTFSHKSSLVTHLRSLHPESMQNSQPIKCTVDVLNSGR